MTEKISHSLLEQLLDIVRENPQQEIPVIVSIRAGTHRATLEQKGLRIQHIAEDAPVVSGTIAAAQVGELAQLDQVEIIECDGSMWALSDDVRNGPGAADV